MILMLILIVLPIIQLVDWHIKSHPSWWLAALETLLPSMWLIQEIPFYCQAYNRNYNQTKYIKPILVMGYFLKDAVIAHDVIEIKRARQGQMRLRTRKKVSHYVNKYYKTMTISIKFKSIILSHTVAYMVHVWSTWNWNNHSNVEWAIARRFTSTHTHALIKAYMKHKDACLFARSSFDIRNNEQSHYFRQ